MLDPTLPAVLYARIRNKLGPKIGNLYDTTRVSERASSLFHVVAYLTYNDYAATNYDRAFGITILFDRVEIRYNAEHNHLMDQRLSTEINIAVNENKRLIDVLHYE